MGGRIKKDKITGIREQMKAKKANIFILTSLDDIAWLLNIRGNDIHCCPVVLSYLVVTDAELRLYANAAAFSEEIRTNLAADGVKIYPYEDVYSYVQTVAEDKKILLSKANVNSRLVSNIPCNVTIVDEPNLTLLPKAVKKSDRNGQRKNCTYQRWCCSYKIHSLDENKCGKREDYRTRRSREIISVSQ
mgnify:CR=1 FL=1